jgi:hypothetical protein
MHAVVFHGPGQKNWGEVPDPKIVDDRASRPADAAATAVNASMASASGVHTLWSSNQVDWPH